MNKLYKETKTVFESGNTNKIVEHIKILRKTGGSEIILLVLDLLDKTASEEVRAVIINLINDLKDPKCIPAIAEYLAKNPNHSSIKDVTTSCWMSGLDYSEHLEDFAKVFVNGDYETSFEALTVIEEMVMNADEKHIEQCKDYLLENENELREDQKSQYKLLLKILGT